MTALTRTNSPTPLPKTCEIAMTSSAALPLPTPLPTDAGTWPVQIAPDQLDQHQAAAASTLSNGASADSRIATAAPSSASFPAQGSEEWLNQRCGKLTASRMGDVMARTKTGWSTSRGNYLGQLVAERLSGQPSSSYESPSMAWGREYEDEARRAYMFRLDCLVSPAGFVDHPNIAMSGASPDGYVGEHGLIEIKAPNTTTHLEIVLSGHVPEKYLPQILWQLACTKRHWCDFVSYDPRLPEHLRFIALRVPCDGERIRVLEEEARSFLGEVDQRVQAITARVIGRPSAA